VGAFKDSDRVNHTLRRALAGLLVVLITTSVVVSVVRAPTTVSAQTGYRPAPVHTSAPHAVGPAPANVVRESGGCELSLSAGAPVVPVGSCTVLEIGDSLGNDLGWGLARELPSVSSLKLVQLDKSSTGLANTGYYDWPTELATDLSLYHPQLVLICLGGNDEQGMEVNGSAVQFPSPAWTAAYLARVRQLISEATASGALVMWVGMPVMEDPDYSQGMEILDSLYRQGVRADLHAAFVSTWQLFSQQGAYQAVADVNGSPENLREPDGIHYSFTGEDVIATYVIDEIASIFHVQLAPTNPAVITGW
jgi:hypothetical protein